MVNTKDIMNTPRVNVSVAGALLGLVLLSVGMVRGAIYDKKNRPEQSYQVEAVNRSYYELKNVDLERISDEEVKNFYRGLNSQVKAVRDSAPIKRGVEDYDKQMELFYDKRREKAIEDWPLNLGGLGILALSMLSLTKPERAVSWAYRKIRRK